MKFKALVLRELNKFPILEDLSLISKLNENQSLVKIITSGICGAQLQEINGQKNNQKYIPHCLGHEAYGEIIETSSPKLKIGDKVILHWRKNNNSKDNYYSYNSNNTIVGAGPITTFSEMSVIDNSRITKINNIDKYYAPLLGCAITTCFGITNLENNLINKKILITGAGGIGLVLSTMIQAKLDLYDKSQSETKLNIIKELNNINLIDKIFLYNKNIKYDCILDTTGNNELIQLLIEKIDTNGSLILISKPQAPLTIDPNNLYKNGGGITIKSTEGGSIIPEIHIPIILNNYSFNNKIITHKFSLEESDKAFNTLISGDAGRILFIL